MAIKVLRRFTKDGKEVSQVYGMHSVSDVERYVEIENPCDECSGRGFFDSDRNYGYGPVAVVSECMLCNGTGIEK